MIEVPAGFEPAHRGFADPCLTTWLRYRRFFNLKTIPFTDYFFNSGYFTNLNGLVRTPFTQTSKCRWIPVLPLTFPVFPIKPMV
jgi:hypothetical protein